MRAEQSRVLLVEEDGNEARAIGRWLTQAANCQVTNVVDAQTATGLASAGNFDALVSTMSVRGGNGLSIVRAYKAQHSHRPAVVIAESPTHDDALEDIRISADDIIRKPLDLPYLASKVEELIERSRTVGRRPVETILAIGAHPDDVEIGCGATLFSHVAQGHRVVIATMSRGARGGCDKIRAEEAKLAAEYIGADLYLEDLPDTQISDGSDTITAIERIIHSRQPTTVYTHSPHDLHQDHTAVHRATLVAARGVRNVLCYQSPSTTADFHPTLFVPVSGFIEEKIDLIARYRSQTTRRPYLFETAIRASATYWGRFAGYVDVEPFMVIRQCGMPR